VHRLSTSVAYEGHLRRRAHPTFGSCPIGNIQPSNVQKWVKELPSTYAPATVAVAHGIVASGLNHAVRDRLIVASPCEGTKRPKVPSSKVTEERILSVDQVVALLEAIPERYRALVALGAAAGPRVSEALGLAVNRTIPTGKARLRIGRQLVHRLNRPPYLGPPKRQASVRSVPLPALAVEALGAHIETFPPMDRDMPVCITVAKCREGLTRVHHIDGKPCQTFQLVEGVASRCGGGWAAGGNELSRSAPLLRVTSYTSRRVRDDRSSAAWSRY